MRRILSIGDNMEIIDKIEMIQGVATRVIYVRYPDSYEFGLDFDTLKKHVSEFTQHIKDYIAANLNKFSDDTALLVLNGIVMGTLVFSQIGIPLSPDLSTQTEIVAMDIGENTKVEVASQTDGDDHNKILNDTPQVISVEESTNETNNVDTRTLPEESTPPPDSNTTAKKPSNPSTNNNTAKPPVTNGRIINLKLASGQIIQIGLEDYVAGVVGSEMPAEFHTEALKAQAIAARTYALKRISTGAILTATTSDQVYKTEAQLKQLWGSSFNTYYTKVKNAVSATQGMYMTYNGSYIDALYFSTSNGKTEDAKYVWGSSHPYLKPVDSHWDIGVRGFQETKSIPMSTISQKLGVSLSSVSQIQINSRTSGDRVDQVTVCGKSFTGVKIRMLLGLRSADFKVSQSGNNIVFTTKGFGHGVGMSQYGANGMAKEGKNYSQILKHYFTGIQIQK